MPYKTICKTHHALIYYICLLVLFLVAIDYFVLNSQRKHILHEATNRFQNDLEVITQAIQEPLSRNQYANIQIFLLNWVQKTDNITALSAVLPNDFYLVDYKTDLKTSYPARFVKKINHKGTPVVFSMTRDLMTEMTLIKHLQNQMFFGSLLTSVLLGLILWLTLQATAVRPLECEIAERKHAEKMLKEAKEKLEERVLKRTNELFEINHNLLLEIDDRIQAENALHDSHQRLLTVLDSLDSIVYVCDMQTHELLFVNQYTKDIFGDIEGKICWQTLQDNQTQPCDFCTNSKLIDQDGIPGKPYKYEFQNTRNQRWYYVQDRAIPWMDGKVVRLEIATDITERKAIEKKTHNSLKEKELLLSEIHHRVKNNMQIISSLLSLQSAHFKDSNYKEMLKESQNRIKSMSLIHEKLYCSEEFSNVNFKSYVQSLSSELFRFYGADPAQIILDTEIENISLPINIAIPCGLIINELLSNALKYAFPNDQQGKIMVGLHQTIKNNDEHLYELKVSDNGEGIPEHLDIKKTKSLGLQLVSTLAEHQLMGSMKLNRNTTGTEFVIRFKNKNIKQQNLKAA